MPSNQVIPREVAIRVGRNAQLQGWLSVPQSSQGVVVWLRPSASAHGGAAEQRFVEQLHAGGLSSLLLGGFDASETEPLSRRTDSMAATLVAVTEWLLQDPDTQPLNIGYLSAGAASAAALIAAARAPDYIDAVVAVDGRLELAGEELDRVRAPTLVISDGNPERDAHLRNGFGRLRTQKSFEVLPTLDFDQGTAGLSCRWFVRHLQSRSHSIPA